MIKIKAIRKPYAGYLENELNKWIESYNDIYKIIDIKIPSDEIAYIIYEEKGE